VLKTCWRSLASRCHTADAAAADVHELSSFSKSLQSTPRNVPRTGGGWPLYRRPWWPHAPRTRIARASPLFDGGPWLARWNGRAIWLSALPCPTRAGHLPRCLQRCGGGGAHQRRRLGALIGCDGPPHVTWRTAMQQRRSSRCRAFTEKLII